MMKKVNGFIVIWPKGNSGNQEGGIQLWFVITAVFSVEMVEFPIKDKSNHKICNLAFFSSSFSYGTWVSAKYEQKLITITL